MIKYHYATVPLSAFLRVTAVVNPNYPDTYLSDDWETRAVQKLLSEGYIFVDVSDQFAIFEKQSGDDLVPVLLDALKRAVNHLIMNGTKNADAPEALAQARAAIAAAEQSTIQPCPSTPS